MKNSENKTHDPLAALRSNDGLSDPFEAVLDTIDRMKEYGLTSSTRQIGFTTVNGKKAQVQICVDTNSMNWIVSDNM